MTDATVTDEEEPKKGSKIPLILSLVFALVGAGGGFFVVQSGLLFGSSSDEHATEEESEKTAEIVESGFSFVPLDPLIISLPPGSDRSLLRVVAQLEVPDAYVEEVNTLKPRIIDVLNGFLRAVDVADLEAPGALSRLRALMFHRVEIVVGEGRVRDFLIMEFFIN